MRLREFGSHVTDAASQASRFPFGPSGCQPVQASCTPSLATCRRCPVLVRAQVCSHVSLLPSESLTRCCQASGRSTSTRQERLLACFKHTTHPDESARFNLHQIDSRHDTPFNTSPQRLNTPWVVYRSTREEERFKMSSRGCRRLESGTRCNTIPSHTS